MPYSLLDHPIFGAEAPADPDEWVFHYTTLPAARLIAESRTLRLSAMARMNDPREFKVAEPMTVDVNPEQGGLSPDIVRTAIDQIQVRRLSVRAASFTSDSADGKPRYAARADARGYARPALWAHYGGSHGGVCLVFDRSGVEAAIRNLFPSACAFGHVDYPEPTALRDPSRYLDLGNVRRVGINTAVDDYFRRWQRYLLFTKNRDWSGEREWRSCVLDQPGSEPITIGLPDRVVVGLVLGLDVRREDLEAVQFVGETFQIGDAIGQTYLHQMNILDVLPIHTGEQRWRPLKAEELRSLGYIA
jgi:hypothetical protein